MSYPDSYERDTFGSVDFGGGTISNQLMGKVYLQAKSKKGDIGNFLYQPLCRCIQL